ncbi:tRNA(His) guanylyltransferase 1-like isoform X3 [Punica granatum]|uniref:tRNA(His) guanylyltransferase n=1 Tax=Punica granatum TaxID=22663 RepID=A0A6P8CX98_PUNGR|nr:tRNA(His) guanylyltransferase 1-like isoform X3 [Punica granatum]
MANSKYEYVKSYEFEDEIMQPNLIVVRLDGRNFERFSEIHEFEKPNDVRALNLMNSCATAVVEEYPDIVFSYGFDDEYSFVFKKTSNFYQRRASKMLTLIVSFFSSVYATKWKEFFPQKELEYPPSFHARVISCATLEVLQVYLAWRQNACHSDNLCRTCFWMLIRSGKTIEEAKEALKDCQKEEKNELLFQRFGINYKKLPEMFRQGSCIFKTEVEVVVKYDEHGNPIKRLRRKPNIVHTQNIVAKKFWNEQLVLVKELGGFEDEIAKIKTEYVKSFLFENKLLPSTYIVIRIDGCHFHRFSDIHGFEKPNDAQALNLMNTCAVAVLKEFHDIVFAYGVSDEYSFVLRKNSQFNQRQASQIVSAIVSFFSTMYAMKWKEFFPQKNLKYPPSFDGRAVCYPSEEILQDYLAWRQVDCHINNQYNTCFWMLVKSGKTKAEAQQCLKGTQTQEKYELLSRQFGTDYSSLPVMFRQGSFVYRMKLQEVVVDHSNIIERSFWKEYSSILEEMPAHTSAANECTQTSVSAS